MNGRNYLLDTNAIIALLQGNNDLLNLLKNADWIAISVISLIEFLAFPNLSDKDREYFDQFSKRVELVNLSSNETELIDLIIDLRKKYKIKLPDAIIAGSAIHNKASLITKDKQLKIITQLTLIEFN
ncbi:MAG: PIN domain-containing protein [Candidatus Eremiobacterota bacterium]